MNVRETAWSVLNKCVGADQYSNLALDAALRRGDFSSPDRGLLTALVYGTLERQLTLDYQISRYVSRAMDMETRNLLRLGFYQLIYLDRVPDHAAVNETVELAPRKTRGFVNAVLRGFLRDGKRLAYPDAASEPIAYLSVRYSFLPAICEIFVGQFGFERTESLLAAFCVQPSITLRVNTLKTTRDELVGRLTADGFDATPSLESASGIHLSGAPVTALAGFGGGHFFVQDEASQLCVEALDAQADMNILDVCACPGSKSFGAAIDMQNRGRVVACDLHANKLSLVRSGAERLGISILETVARDAREPDPEWIGMFDRVLCDVPCSGFGVFAKKPELRYKDPAKSTALPAIQRAILENASTYVKRGGRLVYSTCTLLETENGRNVADFLKAHPEFTLLRERTLTPDEDGCDGFYFAVMERSEA